ncbi:hypothetical protein [Clostridium felsineum]|uniref:hypothetical protein n=1 Tax=Clostridium felsineum TaxID=36839 RepID=UPI0020342FC4|nr:hypothetical protein [Clostridium felsineum]
MKKVYNEGNIVVLIWRKYNTRLGTGNSICGLLKNKMLLYNLNKNIVIKYKRLLI